MNVLLLQNQETPIAKIIEEQGDKLIKHNDLINEKLLEGKKIDIVVSHGYRYIIKKPIIDYLNNNIINLHISLLPWNRGADPNLWSFLEDTPKGVSIHYLDKGIDTGDIIVQKEIIFKGSGHNLATTYSILQNEIVELFKKNWLSIRNKTNSRRSQEGAGSIHKMVDKKKYIHLLTNGYQTSVASLIGKAKKEWSP